MARLVLTVSLGALLLLASLAVAQQQRGLPLPEGGGYTYPRRCTVAYDLQPGERRVYRCPVGSTVQLMMMASIRPRHAAIDAHLIDIDLRSGVVFSMTNSSTAPVADVAAVVVW